MDNEPSDNDQNGISRNEGIYNNFDPPPVTNYDKDKLIRDNKPGYNSVPQPQDGGGSKSRDGKDEEEEQEEHQNKVGFFQLYRYADKWDVLLMVVGTISALANGAAWPLAIIIMGDVVKEFVKQGKYEYLLDMGSDYLALFNFTEDDVRTHPLKLMDICQSLPGNMTDALESTTLDLTCDDLEDLDDLFHTLREDAVIFVGFSAGVMFLSFFQVYFFIKSAERQVIRMRIEFYKSVLRQEIAWFDKHRPGELSSKLTQNIDMVHDAIGDKMGTSLQWYGSCFCGLAVATSEAWELGLLMQLGIPVITIIQAKTRWWISGLASLEVAVYAEAANIAEEVFSAIRTVTAYGGQHKEGERYRNKIHDVMKFGVKKGRIVGTGLGLVWLVMYSNYALGIWYGANNVRYGDYEVDEMMTTFFASLIAFISFGMALPSLKEVSLGMGAAYDIFSIIDRVPEIDGGSTEGLKPTVNGSIRFKGIHFHYPSRKDVKILQGFDLQVRPGQTVALVGSSGCGKSTSMQLLLRFYDPINGQCLVDGVDIKDFNIKWLRQQIGLVSQEPVLFPESIKENIRHGNQDATMDEIIEAAKKANAYNFIMKMPAKFDTYVGERGSQLSGGQKQRIAIARAIVKNPKILLLDEATSALDTESEAIVQDALDRAQAGRTTLVIAHRLSTIQNADVIVALDKGRVAEKGTHEELMAREGIYYQLAFQQMYETMKDSDSDGTFSLAPSEAVKKTSKKPQHDDDNLRTSQDSVVPEEELPLVDDPLLRLFKMNKPEWFYILLGCLGSLLNGALQPIWGIVFSELVKSFAKPDEDDQKDKINFCIAFSIGVAVLSFFAYFSMEYMFSVAGENLSYRIRDQLFRSLLRKEIAYFDDKRHTTGVLANRLSQDATHVQGTIRTLIGSILLCVGNLSCGIIMCMLASWQLMLAMTVFIPILGFAGVLSLRFTKGAANDANATLAKTSETAMSSMDNIRTVASLTLEELFVTQFTRTIWAPHKSNMRGALKTAFALAFSFGAYYLTYALCFGYGAKLMKDDEMDYNDVMKAFAAVSLGAMQMGRSIAFVPNISDTKQAAMRIFALCDGTPTIDSSSPDGHKPAEGTFSSAVHFRGAEFRYPSRPDTTILNGLDVNVQPGQTLALVGESGCGKSTSLQLLERFYDPHMGNVFLDKYPIKDLNVQWLRQQIGLVSQEPTLFDTSIAENIAYGANHREVTMDEIIKAAREANIHNFIQGLPQGYDTNVGSKGTQLSGGQKQRIAIARALVRNPKILLLDEATSALDTESEKIVQEALDKARAGRTCITIAHRLSTIKDADNIAVIVEGKVVEQGHHSKLMSLKGFYHRLQNAQNKK